MSKMHWHGSWEHPLDISGVQVGDIITLIDGDGATVRGPARSILRSATGADIITGAATGQSGVLLAQSGYDPHAIVYRGFGGRLVKIEREEQV